MGVAHRGEIADRLVAGGMAPTTPVAAVRWGTRPGQRSLRTTLGQLRAVELEPPVTIVIGRVAALDLRWFESRPLFGRQVVVTRARSQAAGLVGRLRRVGAETLEVATIEVTDPADGGAALRTAAARAGDFAWVCLASPNAVERLFACLHDARSLGAARVAAVGPGTAESLAARGVVADLVPPSSLAESLVEAFPVGPGRVLLPQAAAALPVLASGLTAKGWQVHAVEAYRTRPATPPPDALAAAAKADAIAFTSSSTVENWLAVAGPASTPPVVACIGPVTAATASRLGLQVSVVAADHTVDGLVAAVVATLGP